MISATQSNNQLLAESWQLARRHLTGDHGRRFFRYFVVGLCGATVNMGLLYLFVQMGGLNHLIASAFACEVSIVSNFVLHDLWTFRGTESQRHWAQRGVYFNAVALTGIVISVSVLALLTDVFGMYYLVANIFAMGAATVTNFMLNSRFTWSIPWKATEPLQTLVLHSTDA